MVTAVKWPRGCAGWACGGPEPQGVEGDPPDWTWRCWRERVVLSARVIVLTSCPRGKKTRKLTSELSNC